MPSLADKKILVTGGQGFLGKYVVEALVAHGVPAKNISAPSSKERDFVKLADCEAAVAGQDIVIHLAAKVGGMQMNREKPGEAFYDNVMMGAQLMDAARRAGVKKFVGISSAIGYPKAPPVPFREEDLWNGYPDEVFAPYGIAKKMLLVQAQAYRTQYGFDAVTLFPANLYGPRDNFDPTHGHVIAMLIKRVADAKRSGANFIEAWGTGVATREFLYAADAAEGIVLAAEKYDKPDPVNLGTGQEVSIKEALQMICKLMDFKGEIRWDASKPDGQPRRVLDATRAEKEFGFKATTKLEDGLKKTIEWYLAQG